jgi:predicted transcriptional regulator
MYSALALKRLSEFVSACGGLYSAAWELDVRPSTLQKVLQNRKLSKDTLQKIEVRFGVMTEPVSRHIPLEREANDTDSSSIFLAQLTSFIQNCSSLEGASSRLGVRPSTLKRLLAGKPVSFHPRQRIKRILNGTATCKPEFADPVSEKLRQAHVLYEQYGTLEAAGREIGLTRERVRQLLVKGSQLGLFEYKPKPFEYPYVSREKLIADYTHFLSLGKVAQINRISLDYLRKLLTAYSITQSDLISCSKEARKARCVDRYNRIMDQLGHHPTTTELQATSEGRTLHSTIRRLWGSIDTFRLELNIPKPPQGSRSIREDTRRWKEQRQRLAFVIRMQHLDIIRGCLSESGPLAASQIVYECNLKRLRVWKLLGLLMATGEVVRVGKFATARYRLVND